MFKEFGGYEAAVSENYCTTGRFCVYAFNNGYVGCFSKRLERPQYCIRCTFRCHKLCARDIFSKFMRITQSYVCNKCYKVFLLGGFQMNENMFKERLKDIQYVKGKAPFFEMPAYNIKSGKSRLKPGE